MPSAVVLVAAVLVAVLATWITTSLVGLSPTAAAGSSDDGVDTATFLPALAIFVAALALLLERTHARRQAREDAEKHRRTLDRDTRSQAYAAFLVAQDERLTTFGLYRAARKQLHPDNKLVHAKDAASLARRQDLEAEEQRLSVRIDEGRQQAWAALAVIRLLGDNGVENAANRFNTRVNEANTRRKEPQPLTRGERTALIEDFVLHARRDLDTREAKLAPSDDFALEPMRDSPDQQA